MIPARRSILTAALLALACAHGVAAPAADTSAGPAPAEAAAAADDGAAAKVADDAAAAQAAGDAAAAKAAGDGAAAKAAGDGAAAKAADDAAAAKGGDAGAEAKGADAAEAQAAAGRPVPVLSAPPDDPLDALYRPSLDLGPDHRPKVTVRLMEGQRTVALRAHGGALVGRPRPRGGEAPRTIRAPAGEILELSFSAHRPGEVRVHPILAEVPSGDLEALEEHLVAWRRRGVAVRVESAGTVFGLAGRIVDNRRTLILADGPGDAAWARRTARAVAEHLPEAPALHETLVERPEARIAVRDARGARLASGESLVTFTVEDGGFIEVLQVEHGVGYDWHGRQDRGYDGAVHVVADRTGLSVVNAVPLETLLRGLVPAEIFASAHPEALAAQAVTARGEVLAKIGVRHLADPALLCASQHCQVYKGRGATAASTDAAVSATAGQVLIGPDGRLVDAVYSAVCGGFTENNEVPWGGNPKPALRGRPDFVPEGEWLRFAAGIGEADLEPWLAASPPTWCNLSSYRNPGKFRWTRRITAAEMDGYVKKLGVGSVRDLEILGRGVSGRIKGLRFVGTRGRAEVHREWPVRRLLGNLPSGAFVVTVERGAGGRPAAFVFRGAGWGHGVGMCQVGAIGMAEHGHDYRRILRHYYNGAEVVRIY